jgi:hypothetical protein
MRSVAHLRTSFAALLLTGFLVHCNAQGVQAGPVTYHVSADDYAKLTIDGSLVGSYDGVPWGHVYSNVSLPSGWYSFELIYKNRFGSTHITLEQDTGSGFANVPKSYYRSLDATGNLIEGLRANYYTLGGSLLGTVYGEGPINHGWFNLYQGQIAPWAGGLVDTNWGLFEERLTGEIFIPGDNEVPEPASALLLGLGGLGVVAGRRYTTRRQGRQHAA